MKKLYNVLICNLKTGEIIKDFNEISHSLDYLNKKYKAYKNGFPRCDVKIKKITKNPGEQLLINYIDYSQV